MKFYIAHTMEEIDFVKAYIEPKIKKVVTTINPFKRRRLKHENKILVSGNSNDVSAISKKIIDRDIDYINKSDGVIAYVPYPSIGASMEIIYAKNKGKLVFLIVPIKELQNHPWLIVFSHKIFENVEDLVKHLNKICL